MAYKLLWNLLSTKFLDLPNYQKQQHNARQHKSRYGKPVHHSRIRHTDRRLEPVIRIEADRGIDHKTDTWHCFIQLSQSRMANS